MATFRQIHIKIWKDGWFLDLPSDHKLLFIYLFSNERANLFGLYDLPVKVICFETDLDADTVTDGLKAFAEQGKAIYENGWIWVRSLLAYNAQNLKSPKTKAHLENTLKEIPDMELKGRAMAHYAETLGYVYPIPPADGVCIPILQEQEQDQEQTTGTEQDQEQQQEPDAGAAVQAMQDHGMITAEDVLDETDLTPVQLIDNVRYAKANDLGAGWVREQARQNQAHAPPVNEDDWRRFLCKACDAHPCTCGKLEEVKA